jgi:predicted enzyme related to lactoylglutathione lyase
MPAYEQSRSGIREENPADTRRDKYKDTALVNPARGGCLFSYFVLLLSFNCTFFFFWRYQMINPFQQHGAFSWTELIVPDVEAAKAFYGNLFDWEFDASTIEGIDYSSIKVTGQGVGGIMATNAQQVQGSPPTQWGVYVTVEDVDQTATLAQELGGKVLVSPMDIPSVGRFAVIQDPQGGVLSVITYGENA